MVDRPVGNRVSSTKYFNWQCLKVVSSVYHGYILIFLSVYLNQQVYLFLTLCNMCVCFSLGPHSFNYVIHFSFLYEIFFYILSQNLNSRSFSQESIVCFLFLVFPFNTVQTNVLSIQILKENYFLWYLFLISIRVLVLFPILYVYKLFQDLGPKIFLVELLLFFLRPFCIQLQIINN